MNLLTGLTLIFVVFKLLGYITWSWWWVFSPTIFQIVLFFLFVALSIFISDPNIRR